MEKVHDFGSWCVQLVIIFGIGDGGWPPELPRSSSSRHSETPVLFLIEMFCCKKKMSRIIKWVKVKYNTLMTLFLFSQRKMSRTSSKKMTQSGVKEVSFLISSSKHMYLPCRSLLFCRAVIWPTWFHCLSAVLHSQLSKTICLLMGSPQLLS